MAQNSDCIDPTPPVPLGSYVPPAEHPRCLCVPAATAALPLAGLDPALPGSCIHWGNCWIGAASKTFNDSTRNANALLALHGTFQDDMGAHPQSLFLSFSIEVPSLQLSQLPMNKLRVGFQRLQVMTIGDTFVMVPRDTVAVLQLKDRSMESGALVAEGLAAALDISFYDLDSSEIGGMVPVLLQPSDAADIIKEPRLWYATGDDGFIGIQFVLPADVLKPVGWVDGTGSPAGETAYKIWYEFDISNQINPNQSTSVSGNTDAGVNYVRSYVWPAVQSIYVGGVNADSESGRNYPAPSQWGTFMPYADRTTTSCPVEGIDLASSQIYMENGAAGISMTGSNKLIAAPQANNFSRLTGQESSLKGGFRAANWGSQPIGVEAPWSSINGCTSMAAALNPVVGGTPALSIGCTFGVADVPLLNDFGVIASQPSQSIPGLRVDMSDDKEFRYIHKSAVNNFSYLTASTINVPAEITTRGLPALPGRSTRDLYVEVIEHNMPRHARRLPGVFGKGFAGDKNDQLNAALDTIIRRLQNLDHDVKVTQAQPVSDAAVLAGTGEMGRAELLRKGIQSGRITAPILRKMISTGVLPIETVEAVVPTYRVRVFHDIGQRDKDRHGVMRDVVEPQYSFGFGALHAGDLTGWRTGLIIDPSSLRDGMTLQQLGSKVYKVSNVPTDGSIRVRTHVEALEPKPWAIGLLLGAAMPTGTYGDQAKAGPAATLTLEREWLARDWPPMISAAVTLGLARIPGGGPQPLQDATVRDIGVGLKVYLNQPADWRVYALPTVDAYHFSGVGTKSGTSLALGLQYELTPAWALDFRYGAHRVRNNAPQSKFSTLQAGVKYSF